jgi:hypothetical protein
MRLERHETTQAHIRKASTTYLRCGFHMGIKLAFSPLVNVSATLYWLTSCGTFLPLMQWCFETLPQSSSSYQSDSNHQPRRSDTIRGCILSQSIETIAVGLFRSAVLACSLFAYTWDFQPRRTKPYAREQPQVARHVREINPRTTIVLPTNRPRLRTDTASAQVSQPAPFDTISSHIITQREHSHGRRYGTDHVEQPMHVDERHPARKRLNNLHAILQASLHEVHHATARRLSLVAS